METDEQLIRKMLDRDKGAMLHFYKRYKRKLYLYIKTKVAKEADAEELLQDTFFAFIEAIRDFHGKSSVKTFLFSICNHKVVDYYRRKKVRHIVFSQMPQLEMLISPLKEPEELLDKELLKEKIQKAFNHILPIYKEILFHKYVEGESVEGIAQKLSLTFKSTEARLFRARKAFVTVYQSIA